MALYAVDLSIFRTRGIMCLTNSLHKCVCVCYFICVTKELKQSHCFHQCHLCLVITVGCEEVYQLRVKVKPNDDCCSEAAGISFATDSYYLEMGCALEILSSSFFLAVPGFVRCWNLNLIEKEDDQHV